MNRTSISPNPARHTLAGYPAVLLIEVPRSTCETPVHRAIGGDLVGRALAANAGSIRVDDDESAAATIGLIKRRAAWRRLALRGGPADIRPSPSSTAAEADPAGWARKPPTKVVVGERKHHAGCAISAAPAAKGDGASAPAGTKPRRHHNRRPGVDRAGHRHHGGRPIVTRGPPPAPSSGRHRRRATFDSRWENNPIRRWRCRSR